MASSEDNEDREPRQWITWAYLLPGLSLYFILPRETHFVLSAVLTVMIFSDAIVRTWLRKRRRGKTNR